MNNPENQGLSANYGDEDIAAINNQWQNFSETVQKEVPFEPTSAEVEKPEKRMKAKSNLKRGLAYLLAAGIAAAGIVGTVELNKAQSKSLDDALAREKAKVELNEDKREELEANTPEYVVDAEKQTVVRNEQTEDYDAAFDENRQNIEETWENDDTTTFMDGPSE